MPLFKTIQTCKNTCIYVWKITENVDFLRDIPLSKTSLNRVDSMKSTQHQKGFLSIRHLLKHIGLQDDDLYYDTFGKPLLKNKQCISISHSFDFSTIAIANQPIGIDIEKNRDKIQTIKHRFTDVVFKNLSKDKYIQQLTFIWAAKESMYKIHPCGGMSFKKDLEVKNITDKTAKGYINTPELKQNCHIYFYAIENYSLAIALTNS